MPLYISVDYLGVIQSHSRPHVCDDNPYSEAHFKTLKYRPDFPQRFGSLEDARAWSRSFFPWYNEHHYHSGLGLLTPATVHYGLHPAVHDQRQRVLNAAFADHPERFLWWQYEHMLSHVQAAVQDSADFLNVPVDAEMVESVAFLTELSGRGIKSEIFEGDHAIA